MLYEFEMLDEWDDGSTASAATSPAATTWSTAARSQSDAAVRSNDESTELFFPCKLPSLPQYYLLSPHVLSFIFFIYLRDPILKIQ